MSTTATEKHIGLTFYGGVSLAVFEAGIAYELVRAVQYSRDAAALPQVPRLHVDVVTGTSAGGLAAFQIAAALAGRNADGVLREMLMLWCDTADIARLLEHHVDDGLLDNSPLRAGAEALLGLAVTRAGEPLEEELDVVLTLTNLDGLGEPVIIDHVEPNTRRPRTLSFPTARHVEYEHFSASDIRDPGAHQRLCDAAVITAGFPVAFPPTLKPSSAIAGSGAEQPFCYVDGGLMDNRPLGVALDCIEKRPAEERWFFFIDPNEVWVDPAFGSIMTSESDRDPFSIARRLFGVARSDTIYDDLLRIRDMRDTLGVMYQLRNALLCGDTRALETLGTAYPEVIQRRFNPEAWSLWMLIQPHVADDAEIQVGWERVAHQERLRLRVRLREYVRALARLQPPLLDDAARDQLLALIDDPGRDGDGPPPVTWGHYYDALRDLQAMDSTLRQLRYRAWRKIKSCGLDRGETPGALSAPITGAMAASAPDAELLADGGDTLNRDIAAALGELDRRARALVERRLALSAWFVARISQRATARSLEEHHRIFEHYARGMQVLESLAGVSYTPSLTVERITPFDIYADTADKRGLKPLAGGELGAFGGFLEKRWRINDFLVGRLTLRRLLERKGILPPEAFVRAPGSATALDYLSFCESQDQRLLDGLPADAPEALALRAFIDDRTATPFADDDTKPPYLLTPDQMALGELATPRLAETLARFAGSLRHLTHDSPHAQQQPYRAMKTPSALAERALGYAAAAVRRTGRAEDRGIAPILRRIERILAILALSLLSLFLVVFVSALLSADREDLWPLLLLPTLGIAFLAGFLTDRLRRLVRGLGRPAAGAGRKT